jgi:hypothetical protein
MDRFLPFLLADSEAKRAELVGAGDEPEADWWRLLRLQIAAHHQFGGHGDPAGPGPLDDAVELARADRRVHYRQAVEAYRRCLGGRTVQWIDRPRRAMWLGDQVALRINPELHVTINGEPHVVKLYCKADPRWALNQRTANPMAWLLHHGHGHLGRPLVIDVVRGRSFGLTRPGLDYDELLRAKTAEFAALRGTGSGSAEAAASPAGPESGARHGPAGPAESSHGPAESSGSGGSAGGAGLPEPVQGVAA